MTNHSVDPNKMDPLATITQALRDLEAWHPSGGPEWELDREIGRKLAVLELGQWLLEDIELHGWYWRRGDVTSWKSWAIRHAEHYAEVVREVVGS